jgi:hypothetical protein
MAEGGADRLMEMRGLAKNLKNQGLSKAYRREAVIGKLADGSGLEAQKVMDTAVRKYFEMDLGEPDMPVVVVAQHGFNPNVEQVRQYFEKALPSWEEDHSEGELQGLIAQWMEIRDDSKAREALAEKYPLEQEVLYRTGMPFDERTEELARELREISGVGLELSKKPRAWADPNRPAFAKHKPIVAETENHVVEIAPREWPTSARAAQFWGLREILESKMGLTETGEVKSPALVILVHGMADREDAEVIIGGGRESEKLGDVNPADMETLKGVGAILGQELQIDGSHPVVAIHRYGLGKDKALQFNQKSKAWQVDDRKGALLSGSNTEIAHLRDGHTYQVGDREIKLPGLGQNLQVVQIEFGAQLRLNENNREQVVNALAKVAEWFKEKKSA